MKSRLAWHLGEDIVLRLYDCMVRDTIDMLHRSHVPFRICFDPSGELERVRTWLGHEHEYLPQTSGDLGERMQEAFARVFSDQADSALLIGSDIPGLTAEIINDAFRGLASHDAVIGPANDGGYYLIGFRKNSFAPEIFMNMTWSTESVYPETLERLRQSSLTFHVLPQLTDADTISDLRTILEEQARRDAPATRTRALLLHHQSEILG